MANLFQIAPINPIRFIQPSTPDARFQNQPFDLVQPCPCYFQKFQTDDVTKIQVLSDFDTAVLKIYDLHTNALLKTIEPSTPDFDIQSQTYLVYEFEIDFVALGVVDCYCEITYINETEEVQTWQSDPIQVLASQPNTILLQYTNSENNFSTVFDTGIVFNLRVEGTIQNFKPEFNDVIYNDQLENATKLSSVPYRSFQLFIGNAPGVPDWMADKVNRAFSCDQFMIDNQYYEKVSGEKWNTKREPENEYLGMQILIMPVENNFLLRLKTGTAPTGDYLPVQKEDNYFAQAADLPIPSIFKKYSLLEKIVIYRYGPTFTLKVGITEGGSEIGTFNIEELIDCQTINYPFEGPGTLYLSGITESATNADFCIIYKQLDTKPITIGSPNPYSSLGVGAVCIYRTPTGQDLSVDFNLGTGLGNVETDWYGWAICDGRNNTDDMGNIFPIGYKAGDPATGKDFLNTKILNPGVSITENNLPLIQPKLGGEPGGKPGFGHGAHGIWVTDDGAINGQNTNSGSQIKLPAFGQEIPVPIPIVPSSMVRLWVQKIANNG